LSGKGKVWELIADYRPQISHFYDTSGRNSSLAVVAADHADIFGIPINGFVLLNSLELLAASFAQSS